LNFSFFKKKENDKLKKNINKQSSFNSTNKHDLVFIAVHIGHSLSEYSEIVLIGGSLAYGTAIPSSDIDLWVIPRQSGKTILGQINNKEKTVDISIFNPPKKENIYSVRIFDFVSVFQLRSSCIIYNSHTYDNLLNNIWRDMQNIENIDFKSYIDERIQNEGMFYGTYSHLVLRLHDYINKHNLRKEKLSSWVFDFSNDYFYQYNKLYNSNFIKNMFNTLPTINENFFILRNKKYMLSSKTEHLLISINKQLQQYRYLYNDYHEKNILHALRIFYTLYLKLYIGEYILPLPSSVTSKLHQIRNKSLPKHKVKELFIEVINNIDSLMLSKEKIKNKGGKRNGRDYKNEK